MNEIHLNSVLDTSLFHRIDINLYPVFITIYDLKSITNAAKKLCITQSAASHALQRLRTHLDDELFVRRNNQMLPTPYAEYIYPILKNALQSIQNISFQNQIFDPKQISHLKIALHDEIEPMVFPQLIRHFEMLELPIQISSLKLNRKTVEAELMNQQIDFAFDLERPISADFRFNCLSSDEFVVCTQNKNIDKNAYLAASHIGVSSRRNGLFIEDLFLAQEQLARNVVFRCQHYSTALQILEQQPNLMLTIPKNVLHHLKISDSIHIFESPVCFPQLNMGMYWLGSLVKNKRHSFLRSEIFKIFA